MATLDDAAPAAPLRRATRDQARRSVVRIGERISLEGASGAALEGIEEHSTRRVRVLAAFLAFLERAFIRVRRGLRRREF